MPSDLPALVREYHARSRNLRVGATDAQTAESSAALLGAASAYATAAGEIDTLLRRQFGEAKRARRA